MTESTIARPATPVWRSNVSRNIPAVDIVSYTFGKQHEQPQDKPIFVSTADPSSYLTYAHVYDLVARLCKGWHEVGLKSGECVTLCFPNNILYPPIWFSVIGAGGVASGANPSLTTPELEHHLQITETKWIVGHRNHADELLRAAAKCHIDTRHIFLFDDDALTDIRSPSSNASSDGRTSASPSVCSEQEDEGDVVDKTGRCADLCSLLRYGGETWITHHDLLKPAVYATTSGTTGLPKAAVLPHQYLVSQALMLEGEYVSRQDPIQLISLPIFHTFASNCAIVLPLRLGITTYISPRFKPDDFIENVPRFSVTDAPVVPPIVSTLVQQGKEHGHKFAAKVQSLRRLICAGSPMKQSIQHDLYQYLHPDCRISQCWGTTETGWVTLTPGHELDDSGSVGRLTMNTELKLVDGEENVIHEEGRQGEALVRSTSMFLGYLQNDAANESAFDSDQFYRTGDRTYFKDDKVFVEGRIKDTFKVKAFQVSPEELETKIQAYPSVIDCAVVGYDIADAAGLEQTHPRAYVVVSPDSGTTAQDIYDWVASQTASYKHLTGGIIFIEAIPRNASGPIGYMMSWTQELDDFTHQVRRNRLTRLDFDKVLKV